jgi:hypothetical protein
MTEEFLNIPRCPQCHTAHRYRLRVRRGAAGRRGPAGAAAEAGRPHRFVRQFICPITREVYRSAFFLEEAAGCRVEDVEVLDPEGGRSRPGAERGQ